MGRWSRRLAAAFAEFVPTDGAGRVLDVGAGTGSLTRAIAEARPGALVVGVDPVVAYVAHARRSLPNANARFLAGDALARLGGDLGDNEDSEVPGLGIDKWRVVERGSRFFAVSDQYRRLRVPLEMAGEGQPRLLEWEIKPAPLASIATLRFKAGVAPGSMGPEEIEHVAILDLEANTVIAIEPHRQGKKVANWTWEGDRVVVASVDGATDEFVLRTARARGQLDSGSQYDRPRRRRSKPKSIFQLLFGN